jgi:transposase InsO family protein
MAQVCARFGISRQAHYQKQARELQRTQDEAMILELVRQIRRKHPRMGVRKLHKRINAMLASEGRQIGRDWLFELLRKEDLLVQRKKAYKPTTKSGSIRAPNRLLGLTIMRPNQVWVCDITYLKLRKGRFAFLFVIMDLYSRYIVGWHVSSSLAVNGALSSLSMALGERPEQEPPVIHHSDHGVQYTSHLYMNSLSENRILPSMGAVGNCYDNIFAERLIGVLKQEYLFGMPFDSLVQTASAVKETVDLYNHDRPHTSLNMEFPVDVYYENVRDAPVLAIPREEE